VADPDLELSGEWSVLLALPAFLPPVIFFLFLSKVKGGGGGGPPGSLL